MLAMPVATFSADVADSRSVALMKGSRPIVSGIHSVGNPRSSSWATARRASADDTASSAPVQMPTRPRSKVFPMGRTVAAPLPPTANRDPAETASDGGDAANRPVEEPGRRRVEHVPHRLRGLAGAGPGVGPLEDDAELAAGEHLVPGHGREVAVAALAVPADELVGRRERLPRPH